MATTLTINTIKELKKLFNFSFQPHQITSVNGIAVNVFTGSLKQNELEVTNTSVKISSYLISHQKHVSSFLQAPFTITFGE